MKQRKRIVSIMLTIVLTLGMTAAVFASANKPYGEISTTISGNTAYAYINST